MADPSKFSDLGIYYMYHLTLLLLIIAEAFIFFYTHQSTGTDKRKKADKGTKWMLIINFYICIYISFFMVSNNVHDRIVDLKLPVAFSYIGVVLMLTGIVIRLLAVFTLKRAFTLSVQTAKTQNLITTGIYSKVRNPAYSGSICSLLGTAIGLRSPIATVIVLVLSFVCYSTRIYIEEKALRKHFGNEFIDYEKHTFRLIPLVW